MEYAEEEINVITSIGYLICLIFGITKLNNIFLFTIHLIFKKMKRLHAFLF